MKENSNDKKAIFKKWWFWCILIVLIILVVLVIVFINKSKSSSWANVQSIDDVMLPEFNKTGTASEKVLYDQNNVKITFKGITYGTNSAAVNLEFTNNNSEELKFISGSTGFCKNSVNEFMIYDAYINKEVGVEETVTDSIKFQYDFLQLYGIDEIAEIVLNFEVSGADYNSDFKDFYTDPLVIQTSLYDYYDFNKDSRYLDRITSKAIEAKYNSKILQKDTTKNSIVENLDIVSMVRMQNKDGEEAIMLETVNNCGNDVKVKISDIKFNDTMIYDYTWETDEIMNNKMAILDIIVASLEDEEGAKNIEKIERLSFKVSIIDSDGKDLLSQEISYTIDPAITLSSSTTSTTTPTSTPSTSSTTQNESKTSSTNSTGISQEFKDAMDAYESCMNEYVEYMKKYKANPSDLTLLSQYSTMLQKYSEQTTAFNKWNSENMTTEEAAYYIDVQARVSKKILEVTQ